VATTRLASFRIWTMHMVRKDYVLSVPMCYQQPCCRDVKLEMLIGMLSIACAALCRRCVAAVWPATAPLVCCIDSANTYNQDARCCTVIEGCVRAQKMDCDMKLMILQGHTHYQCPQA
jgi:hypothetical protein